MSDALLTAVFGLFGVTILACSAVVMALRSKGDRVITWKGFGVTFQISPCSICQSGQNLETVKGDEE